MTTYVRRNGRLVEKDYADPLIVSRSATSVISDTMAPLKHMATGRMIDSKSEFRKDTRASGCIETGNEMVRAKAPVKLDPVRRRDDIRRAVYELRNR